MATRFVVTIALIVCAAMPLAAQGSVGFGPQVGFYKSRDADDMRVMGGAALRLKFSRMLGVEGSINYREEEYSNGAVKVTSWPVMVTGLVYPIPIVYGAIGAGWYNSAIDYRFPAGLPAGIVLVSSESKQEFGWHFGGGLELPLGSVGKLVGDVRYVFLDYDFQKFPGSNGVNSNFYVITASVLFGL